MGLQLDYFDQTKVYWLLRMGVGQHWRCRHKFLLGIIHIFQDSEDTIPYHFLAHLKEAHSSQAINITPGGLLEHFLSKTSLS